MVELSWRGVVLGFGALLGLLLVGLLLTTRPNRLANAWLAALIGVFLLFVTPRILGMPPVDPAAPWLSHAPWELVLLAGPCLWFHMHALAHGRLPERFALHLVPGGLQFAVSLWFVGAASDGVRGPWFETLDTIAELVSLGVYLWLTARTHQTYRRSLAHQRSDAEEFRLPWIPLFIAALAATLALYVATTAIDLLFGPLPAGDPFWVHLWLSALVYWLGFEGWRNADRGWPRVALASMPQEETIEADDDGLDPVPPDPTEGNWNTRAHAWASRIATQGWWREPDLTLDEVARRLGESSDFVSHALIDGLGQDFHTFVNGFRVRAVCRAIETGDDRALADIAREAGFVSERGFERVFRAQRGVAPAQWRARHAPGPGGNADLTTTDPGGARS